MVAEVRVKAPKVVRGEFQEVGGSVVSVQIRRVEGDHHHRDASQCTTRYDLVQEQ